MVANTVKQSIYIIDFFYTNYASFRCLKCFIVENVNCDQMSGAMNSRFIAYCEFSLQRATPLAIFLRTVKTI
jgi:hypothetical protein